MYYNPLGNGNAIIHHDSGEIVTQLDIDDENIPLVLSISDIKKIGLKQKSEKIEYRIDLYHAGQWVNTIVPPYPHNYDDTVNIADDMQHYADYHNTGNTYLVKEVK